MTASLLVLMSVGVLAVVSGLCFVGCFLDTSGTGVGDPPKPKPYTDYSQDVMDDPSIAAYWPLNEPTPADASGKIKCDDVVGSNDGEYKHKGNDSNLFPIPAWAINPGIADSAAASGFLELGAVSLVAGDAEANDPDKLKTGMLIDGALVTVPFSTGINPPKFTVEAWVRPDWSNSQPAYRCIVDSREQANGPFQGFVLWSKQDHHWEAGVADANGVTFATSPDLILFGQPAYLAFTFDGVTVALFVNGKKVTSAALAAAYQPNTTKNFIIGGSGRWLDDRVSGMGNGFPILPYSGAIQNVAIYNAVLSDDTIATRFEHGSGKPETLG